MALQSQGPLFLCTDNLCHCRGGAEVAAAAAAQRAAGDAQQHMMDTLPEKLDEFGRDENMELREDISLRASKRAARYAHVPAQQSQVWVVV